MWIFLLAFILSFIFSAVLIFPIKKLALYFNILDKPDFNRKIHQKEIPLMGGLAIFIAFFTVIFIFKDQILNGSLETSHWLGFFMGSFFLLLGGILDDKYNLNPLWQIVFPILAIISVLLGGVEITKISNPLGGMINIAWLSPILIFIWLMGMMYTTKLLDGVDGLVGGVSTIAALVIFLFTITTKYYQADIAFASMVLAGAILGFLVYNFHPASIFLGEGGSLFLGFSLGVLAIISGGKIAIALLVMGIPILDLIWTVIRRLVSGKNPFKVADKKHLHHRLLSSGLSQKQTVFIFYFLSSVFGLTGLFLQSQGKFLALGILFLVMILLVGSLSFINYKKRKPKLLLHVCCAPCSAYIIRDVLSKDYDITIYFNNSNLSDKKEYDERIFWVKNFADNNKIPLIIEEYEHDDWLESVKGRESDPEKGARCMICYRSRLEETVKIAKNKKFDYFSSSLLVSPYKDKQALMNISRSLADKYGLNFLEKDLQADNAYRKSQDLAKELGFYRQKFCGCEFTKR